MSAEGCGFTWELNYSSGGRKGERWGGLGGDGQEAIALGLGHACTQAHRNTQLMLSGILAQSAHRPPWHTENLPQSPTPSPACWRPQSSARLPETSLAPRSLPGLEFFLGWKLNHESKDLTSPPPQYYTEIPAHSPGRCRGGREGGGGASAAALDLVTPQAWALPDGESNVEKQNPCGGA